MNNDLRKEIKFLEDEVIQTENKINDAISKNKYESVSKYTSIIHSDLRTLNIVANSAPLKQKEYRQIRDFIQIHYENLRRIPVYA